MAGRRNQRRLAALQRLRDRADRRDEAIRAWQRSTDVVRAAESELEDCGPSTRRRWSPSGPNGPTPSNEAQNSWPRWQSLSVTDSDTALLDVPLHEVHAARPLEHAEHFVEAADGKGLPG
jgi:hypothetical protein